MKKKQIQKIDYEAPIFLELQEKVISRMPGISSQWKWIPGPGLACQFSPIQHIQLFDESAPQMWPHLELSIVPPGALSPEIQTGILLLGFQKIYHVLPKEEAPENWETIKIVEIPNSFYQYFAPHIEEHKFELKYGEYFPKDYKIIVSIPENQIAPKTWIRLGE